ncbi:PREDICTED: probable proline dehydrogenase 2 [Branchiostoma belcheri]|uniref:Proline dehydrogenase n=1 Tax=Branchiostoma belcheri TaxID=7741 RepID=A0A6P4YPY9_BRABE|nr:PREDICTED: probable proline dehydrogenase 2 [Branchiostoma belcheri]
MQVAQRGLQVLVPAAQHISRSLPALTVTYRWDTIQQRLLQTASGKGDNAFPARTTQIRQGALQAHQLGLDLSEETAAATAELSFDDPTQAFKTKSTWEIARALLVLRLCSFDVLVDNSLKLMKVGQRFLGRRLFEAVMRATFYGQFIGGDSEKEIEATVRRLLHSGIQTLPAITIEEDIGDEIVIREEFYDSATQFYLDSIRLLARLSDYVEVPLFQLRVTSFLHANLLVIMSKHLDSGCPELSVENLASGLAEDNQNFHVSVLTDQENDHLRNTLRRIHAVCRECAERRIWLTADAEYTYMRPAMTQLMLAAMFKFNRDQPLIWNTYQCYLKGAHDYITRDIQLAKDLGMCFGVKLVRGAYMDKERALAKKKGYEDPINPTYEATGEMYHRLLDTMLGEISTQGQRCRLIVASHNEQSIKYAVARMRDLGIEKNDGRVCFGQLYGMCDQVSYPLGQAGYAVYKSTPIGPMETTLAYLQRRALENRSVLSGIRKERDQLWSEMKRRMVHPRSWKNV